MCGFGIYQLKSLLTGNVKIMRDISLRCCSNAGVSVYTTPFFNSNSTYPASTYTETVFTVPFDITSLSYSTQGLAVSDSASVNDPLVFGTMSLAIVQSCPAPYAVSGLYARIANGGGDLTYFPSVFAYCSTRCSRCPGNSYCVGNTTAALCPPNTDSPAGSSSLVQCTCLSGFTSRGGVCYCPVNTFLVGSGVGACTACRANSVCTGDNILLPCPRYSTAISNGSAWSPLCLCDVGYYSAPNTYSALIGDSECLLCPANSGTLARGGRSPLDCVCAPGFIASSPGAVCSPCSPGGYCPVYGGGSVLCVPGTFQTGYGMLNASGCRACAPGTYSTAVGSTTTANCILCAMGTFHAGSGATIAEVCQSCLSGTYGPVAGMSACTPCKAGTVQPATGVTSQAKCSPCMAGTYQTGLGMGPLSSCIQCPAGTYQTGMGMGNLSGCIQCRAGLYQPNIGQPFESSCLPCQAGTFQTNLGVQTSAQCVACAAGGYQSASGSEQSCTPCAKGTYSFAVGQQTSSTCIKCREGLYQPVLRASSVDACVECALGTYQTGSGMRDVNDCMVCGTGTFQSRMGATSASACTACPSGTYQSGLGGGGILDCVVCSPGTFQTGTGADSVLSCISCQTGTYQPFFGANTSAQCIPCAAGKYFAGVGVAGIRDCIPCSLGTYQTAVGSTTGSGCNLCGPGTYQSGLGGSSLQACTLCSPGTYQTGVGMGAVSACLPCGQGTFSSGYGATALKEQACTPCASGTYQPTSTPGASTCLNCDAGEFQTGSGSALCSICGPGKYQPMLGAKYDWYCTPCEQGTYSTASGAPAAANCTSCKEGTFADSEGLTSCLPCARGKYTPSPREPICFSCMSGTYSNRTGGSACTPCPAGKIAAGVGNTECIDCEPRQFQFQQGASACLPCPPGLFQFRSGSTKCEQCTAGKFQPGYNQSECEECSPGTYSDTVGATLCAACSAGEHQPNPNATACQLCAAGSFQNRSEATDCVPCAVGWFQSTTGTSTCISCKAGTFQPATGATDCLKCREGTYQTALALARLEDCVNCTAGYFGAYQGLAVCAPCAVGHYARQAGSALCTSCEPGSFQNQPNATACTLCSVGTFSTAWGAASPGVCQTCSPGEFSALQGSTGCSLCPAGTHTAVSGAIACTPCAAGTFMESPAWDGDRCTPCVAGTFSYELGANSSETCQLCDDGYFSPNPAQATHSSCLECPSGTVSVANKTLCRECVRGTLCPPGYSVPIHCVAGLVCNGTHMSASPTFLAILSHNCTAAIPCPRGTHCALGDVTRGPGLLPEFPNQTHFVVYSAGPNATDSSCPGFLFSYGYARVNWPFVLPPVPNALYWLQPVGCPAGMYLLDDVCTNCPIGMFSGSGNALDWDVCQPCPAGTFGAVLGATSCTACRPGEYSDVAQAIVCQLCASGTYQGLTGASACLPCPGGAYVDRMGADACTPCAAGDFQPSTGTTVCAACGPLQYSSSGDHLCSECGTAPLALDPGYTCPPLSLPTGTRTTSSIWLSMQGQKSDECLSTGPVLSSLTTTNELAVSYSILHPYAVCTTNLYVSDRPTLTKTWTNSVGQMGRPFVLYVIPYNATFYPVLCRRQGFGVLFTVADEIGGMDTNMTGAKAVLTILDVSGMNVLFRMACGRLPKNSDTNVPLGVCRTSFCPTMKVIVRVTLTWAGMSTPPVQDEVVLSPGPVGFCPPTLSWLVVVELQQGSVPYLPGDTLTLQVHIINPPAQGVLDAFRFTLRILPGVTMLSFQSSYSVVTDYIGGLLSVVGDSTSLGGGAILGVLQLRLDASASGVMLVAQAVASSFKLTMTNAIPYTMLVRTMGFSCRSDGYVDMLADFPRPTALITNSNKRYVINWRKIQSTALDLPVSIYVISVSNVMHVFGSVTATCTSLAPSSLQVTSCGLIRGGALSNATAAVRVQYQSMVKVVIITSLTPVNTTFTAIPSRSGLSGRYKVTTTLYVGENALSNVDATPYIPNLLAMGATLANQQWKCSRSGASFAIGAPVLYSRVCGNVPSIGGLLPQAAASIFLVTGGGQQALGRYTFDEPHLSPATPMAALLLFSPSGVSLGITKITSRSPLNQVLATSPNSPSPVLSLHNTGTSGRCVAVAVESDGVTYVRSLPVFPAAPVSLQVVLSTYILVSQRDTSMFLPTTTFVLRAALFFSDGTQLPVQSDPRLSMTSDLLDVTGMGATARYDAVNASIVLHFQGIQCVSSTVWVRVAASSVVSSELLCPTCPQVLASQDDPLSQQFPLVYPSSVPLAAVVVRRLLVDGQTIDRVESITLSGDALDLVGTRLVGKRQGVASISSPLVLAPLLLTVLDRWATSVTLMCNQMVCSTALKFAPLGDGAGSPPFSYTTSLVLSLSVGLADGRDAWFPWLWGVVPLINQTRFHTVSSTVEVPLSYGDLAVHTEFDAAWRISDHGGARLLRVTRLAFLSLQGPSMLYQLHCSGIWEEARFTTTATLTDGVVDPVAPEYSSLAPLVMHRSTGLFHAESVGQAAVTARFGGHEVVSLVLVTVSSRYFTAVDADFLPSQWNTWRGQSLALTPALTPALMSQPWYDPMLVNSRVVGWTSSAPDIIQVSGDGTTLTLLADYYAPVVITATLVTCDGQVGTSSAFKAVTVNVIPSASGDIDFGQESGDPVPPVSVGQTMQIPVFLYSSVFLQSYMVELELPGSGVEPLDCSPGVLPNSQCALTVSGSETGGGAIFRSVGAFSQSQLTGRLLVAVIKLRVVLNALGPLNIHLLQAVLGDSRVSPHRESYVIRLGTSPFVPSSLPIHDPRALAVPSVGQLVGQQMVWGDTDGDGGFTSMDVLFMEKYMALSVFKGEQAICVETALCQLSTRLTVWQLLQLKPLRHPAMPASKPDAADVIFLLRALVGKTFFLVSLDVSSLPGRLSVAVGLRDYTQRLNPPNAAVQLQIATNANRELAFDTPFKLSASTITVACVLSSAYIATSLAASSIVDETSVGIKLHTQSLDSWGSADSSLAEDRGFSFLPAGPVFSFNLRGSLTVLEETMVFDYLPTTNCVALCDDASLFLDNSQGLPLWLNDSALAVHYETSSPRFSGVWAGLTPELASPATPSTHPLVVVDVARQAHLGQGVGMGQLFNMTFKVQAAPDTVALYRVLSSPYVPLIQVYGGDSPDGTGFFLMSVSRGDMAQLEFRMSGEGAHVISVALVDSYPESSQSVIQTFWGLPPAITGLEITPLCVDGVILWSALVPSAHDEPCEILVTPIWTPDGRGAAQTFTCTTYPCVLQGFGQVFRVNVPTFTPSSPRLLVQRVVLSLGYTTQWRATCNLANSTMLDITVTERALAAGLIRVSPANALVITGSRIRAARQGWATVSFGGLVKTGFNVTFEATPPVLLKGLVFSTIELSQTDASLLAVFATDTLLAGGRGFLLLRAVYGGGYTLLLDPTPGTDGISVVNASSDVVVSQADGSFRVRRGALGGANHPIVTVGYQGVYTVVYGTIIPMAPASLVLCCSPSLASTSSALSGHPKYPSSFVVQDPVVNFAGSHGAPLAVKFTDASLSVTYDMQVMRYSEATGEWTLDQLAPASGTSDILVRYTHPVSLISVEARLTVFLVDADRLDVTPAAITSHRIHCSSTVFESFGVSARLHLTGLGSLDVTDEIVAQSSNPAVASVFTNEGTASIAGVGVGSGVVTVNVRGLTGVVAVQVLDESVVLQSVSAPSNYDLSGVEGSRFPIILNGSIGSAETLTDLSFLDLLVVIADRFFPSELESNRFIVIRGNTMVPTTLTVTVPVCGAGTPLSASSALQTHVLANTPLDAGVYGDVEIRFNKTRESFVLTMVAAPTVFAFLIQLQTDAATITQCTLLDGMPLFSDCNTDVPALGALVLAGARSAPFPNERTILVEAFWGGTVSNVWGVIEIYTGLSVIRYSIQAGVHGGPNASVDLLVATLPVVDTSVLSKHFTQLFAVFRSLPLRNVVLDLLLLVSRQKLVDTRIYSNEFELSAMFHVTDRFLVPDANESRLSVLFHTDKLQTFPVGVQTPLGFSVEAQYAFDGWYVVEFRQKIPVLRLAISFYVSTATSRVPWVWQVEGTIDTGLPLPPCPRSATYTATFLATYYITLPAFNNLSVLSRELLDRVACDVHVPSRRVMATAADTSGTITLTVALESLDRVHQTNLALMDGAFIDELARRIGVDSDNASLMAIERGDVQYINDTRDASTICPEGVYFMGNGTYQQLPPHAIAGADCYGMVCMDQYTLIVETQRCVPTPVSMDVLWICVVVVLTVVISLAALVCCVQLAHWKTTNLADVVFDPSQPPAPTVPSDTPPRPSAADGNDPFQDADNTRMLYYPDFVTGVTYDAHSAMMVDAMFSPLYAKGKPTPLFYG